jgi:hypothetical protein
MVQIIELHAMNINIKWLKNTRKIDVDKIFVWK